MSKMQEGNGRAIEVKGYSKSVSLKFALFLIILKTVFAPPVYGGYQAGGYPMELMEPFYEPFTGGSLFPYPASGSTLGSNVSEYYIFPGDSNDRYHVVGCSRPSAVTMYYGNEIVSIWPPQDRAGDYPGFGNTICSAYNVPQYCMAYCPDTDFPDVVSLGIYKPTTPPYFFIKQFKKIGSFTTFCTDIDNGVRGDWRWVAAPDYYYYYIYKEQPSCDLNITNFSGNREIIHPSDSESVAFAGIITETTGQNVSWTLTLTDISGATWRTFSGRGTSVSVNWDGKDSFGRIVNDGLYTAKLEAQTTDGNCKKSATAQVTVKSSCNVSDISILRSWVFPQQTGGTITKASISVMLATPAPSAGCIFKLGIEPLNQTGGHKHTGGRPTGSLSSDTVTIPAKETGPQTVKYISGEVAGTEKIIVALLDDKGNATSWKELTIDVKVPILGPLGDGGGWWRLTGQTDSHPDNHYGAPYTVETLPKIAIEYYRRTGTSLGINDMSIEWGGLFDIDEDWTTPHITHRKGTSADIDRRVYNQTTGQEILIDCEDDDTLDSIVARYTAHLLCESGGRKHIDFY